jgi:hypothetical protein
VRSTLAGTVAILSLAWDRANICLAKGGMLFMQSFVTAVLPVPPEVWRFAEMHPAAGGVRRE